MDGGDIHTEGNDVADVASIGLPEDNFSTPTRLPLPNYARGCLLRITSLVAGQW